MILSYIIFTGFPFTREWQLKIHLIKHYFFNPYSICFCNFILLDSRLNLSSRRRGREWQLYLPTPPCTPLKGGITIASSETNQHPPVPPSLKLQRDKQGGNYCYFFLSFPTHIILFFKLVFKTNPKKRSRMIRSD